MRLFHFSIRPLLIAVAIAEVGLWTAKNLDPRMGWVALLVLSFAHVGCLFMTYMTFYSALDIMQVRLGLAFHLSVVALLHILIFKVIMAMLALP